MFCLKTPTDPAWVHVALEDLDVVLVDHAHCEMKAASNALSLATRHLGNTRIALALSDLAREEIDHFQQVLRILERRGIVLGAPPVDAYAAELRRMTSEVREDREGTTGAMIDRLLVCALIEARSCERFKLLVDALREGGPQEHRPHERLGELRALYAELFAAEARHYRTFVDLATLAASGDEARVAARLARLSELEGQIVVRLAAKGESRASVHG